jgi:hypothetical protein
MAIVQISKIKVRTGSITELPQLDEGELGWASDERRLFIGNPIDPNNSGPQPQNTEIITQYSPTRSSGSTGLPIDGTTGQYLRWNQFGEPYWADLELPTYYVEFTDNLGNPVQIDVLPSGTAATVSPPASATSTGIAGQIAYDSSYVYVCVATNTWKRSALSSW